ncbi:O-antigen ligase family protein [Salmonirosea aquatica]|uniref:O-antigen ligase family protein n=1 Tax=Salmonirosea aquatica TaxID=2654236 RepID=UPI00128BD1EC
MPVFGLLFIPSVILSEHPTVALFRLFTILIYLFYLEYFFRTTSTSQSARDRHFILIEIFRFVYFVPIAIYLINTPTLGETNIYGEQSDDLGLTSNNFGWAASFYFLLTIDRIKNFPNSKFLALIDVLTLPIALYLVIISGSRSSTLAIALSGMLLILLRRNISLTLKTGLLIGMTFIYLLVSSSQNLALNRHQGHSKQGVVNKESRLLIWNDIFSIVSENPQLLLFGVGPDNSTEAVNKYKHRFYKVHPHNTYIIVLFESGIICFAWFVLFFIAKPLIFYFKNDASHFSYILHPFVISFFDHNLGPGQFLAFPLFSLIFFYLYRSSPSLAVRDIAVLK